MTHDCVTDIKRIKIGINACISNGDILIQCISVDSTPTDIACIHTHRQTHICMPKTHTYPLIHIHAHAHTHTHTHACALGRMHAYAHTHATHIERLE
jgi:hypothetical protein